VNERISHIVHRYPALETCAPQVQVALDLLAATFANGGKVLPWGNGGSASDCERIVGEGLGFGEVGLRWTAAPAIHHSPPRAHRYRFDPARRRGFALA